MYRRNHLVIAVAASCAAMIWLSADIASADGLPSQGKFRIPQQSGSVFTVGTPIMFSKPVSDKEKIGLLVLKSVRSRERRTEKVQLSENGWKLYALRTHFGQRVDRAALLQRGSKKMPLYCMQLHTHERATCLRDADFRQTNRMKEILRDM